MAFSQFDLSKVVRCSATNDEGYSCRLSPSHGGEHRWDRCEAGGADGHRCMLPIRHAGDHQLSWYDRPAAPGQTHTLHYGGSQRQTETLADRATRIAERYGWVRLSQAFRPGLLWRVRPVSGWLSGIAEPQGGLTVVFEYTPPQAVRDPKSE